MDKEDLLLCLKKAADLDGLVTEAGNSPDFLNDLFEIVRSERSTVRYSCTKVIRMLSEQQPDTIYPHFDDAADWLRDSNSFVKWDGILTLVIPKVGLSRIFRKNRLFTSFL